MDENGVRKSLALQGPCTMDRISTQLELARVEYQAVLELPPAPGPAHLDLQAVTELDACGCQLLAVLVDNLKRVGISAVPRNLSAELAGKVELLGFAAALGMNGTGEDA